MKRHLQYAIPAICLFAASAAADEAIHPPATAAERALAATLKAADDDDYQLDNLLAGRGKPAFHKTFDYQTLLTDALISAIAEYEKALVKSDCGGQYTQGETCGLDYSPITCAQDSADIYLYRTIRDDGAVAEISYRAPESKDLVATYRLIMVDGRWKIDGVKCEDGDTFN
jgi:hypothetical protein